MVQTITPVVHGGRTGHWGRAVALHALGAGVAASAFGALLGGVGILLGAPWGRLGIALVIAAAGIYAARELVGVPVPLPDRHRQVPEWWRSFFPPNVASLLYGATLGVGFFTYLRHGTLVAVAVAAVVTGDPLLAAFLVAPFGVARGISVAVVGSGRTADGVARVVDRLDALAGSTAPRLVNGLALVAIAVTAAVAGIPGRSAGPHPVAAVILAVVFGWAAAAKVADPGSWREALRAYRLPRFLERSSAVAVPLAEAAVVAVALVGSVRIAAGLATVLLATFSAAVVRAWRTEGPRLPCGCFGGRRIRDVRWLLARNVALLALAVAVLADGAMDPRLPGLPTATELIPATLAMAGLGLAAFLVRRAAALLGNR